MNNSLIPTIVWVLVALKIMQFAVDFFVIFLALKFRREGKEFLGKSELLLQMAQVHADITDKNKERTVKVVDDFKQKVVEQTASALAKAKIAEVKAEAADRRLNEVESEVQSLKEDGGHRTPPLGTQVR